MIRKATINDINSIVKLYSKVKLDRSRLSDMSYCTEIQKKGFLLGLDNKESLLKEIEEAYDFIVTEEKSQIIGYLIADHRDKEKFYDDEYKTWFDKNIKNYYYQNSKGMTIAAIAVDPMFSGKGIATLMLKSLETKLLDKGFKKLFSIVSLAPLTNCSTIVWHTKNGFQRLAMGKPRERLFELDWYSGLLLVKDLR